MGRAFVAKNDSAAFGGLAFGLSLDQPGHAGGQQGDIALLPGNDIGQVLDRSVEVRNLFLKVRDVIHAPQIDPAAPEIKP